MPTFLVVAAHGYGNVGDDLCAHGGAHLIKALRPDSKVIVTSPPYNHRLVKKADCIILSGGGIIYDRVLDNVENYLRYLRYAQERNLPTAVIGIGVQGIVTEQGRQSYREVFNRANLVTTRSISDQQMLTNIGVKNVTATQDLGFLADEWLGAPRFKPRLIASSKPRLGLVLQDVRKLKAYQTNNTQLKRYIEITESNLGHLSEEFDIHLFAHSRDDETWRSQLSNRFKLEVVPYRGIKDAPRFRYLYEQMDLVVGSRFHAVILGLLANKPTVGVGGRFTKLFRLGRETPTLKAQSFPIGDSDGLADLFKNLRPLYDSGRFKVLPKEEIGILKAKAKRNLALLEKTIPLF